MTLTLEQQQHATIRYLPTAIDRVISMIKGSFSDYLGSMIASRLDSGSRVFGDKMFTWEAGDLHDEAVEELADAMLYYIAYLYVVENGSPNER